MNYIKTRFPTITYDFFPYGYFIVPRKNGGDKTKEMLVMITCYSSEWHRLALMTDTMYKQAIDATHNSGYGVFVIITELLEDSYEYIGFLSDENPVDDNCIVPNQYTWERVTREQDYINKKKYLELEHKYEELKSRSLKDNERSRLRQEYKEAKEALQAERQEFREEKNARKNKPTDTRGYVYLLKVKSEEDVFKIGRAKNPKNRLRTFNVKLPFPVDYEHLIETDDRFTLESELHDKFADKRMNGSEFFKLTEEDVEYIKQL